MHGIGEIRKMNNAAAALPQTKREVDFRVQRDKLVKALRRVLDEEIPFGRTRKVFGAVEEAEKVLAEINGHAKQ